MVELFGLSHATHMVKWHRISETSLSLFLSRFIFLSLTRSLSFPLFVSLYLSNSPSPRHTSGQQNLPVCKRPFTPHEPGLIILMINSSELTAVCVSCLESWCGPQWRVERDGDIVVSHSLAYLLLFKRKVLFKCFSLVLTLPPTSRRVLVRFKHLETRGNISVNHFPTLSSLS